MERSKLVWVGGICVSLTKITTLQRKAAGSKVLAAKHTASLQLLCTAGGNQARLDARTEFKIPERSPKGGGVKLVVQLTVCP